MADVKQAEGLHWDGFAPGQTPAPDIAGSFRTFIDGDNARIVDGKFGKQLKIPARVSLGRDGERSVSIYCPYHFGLKGKIVSIFKAISNIPGDLPDDFDLSTLATSGDVLAECYTDDKGYLQIKSWIALPRYENGAPNVPDSQLEAALTAQIARMRDERLMRTDPTDRDDATVADARGEFRIMPNGAGEGFVDTATGEIYPTLDDVPF